MAVPWTQIIQWAPQILSLSRELLQRARRTGPSEKSLVRAQDPADQAARIAALEENERRQAELVDRMAAQLEQHSRALISLHRQLRWTVAAVIGLGALSLLLFFRS
jgi:hypothetical protein